MSDARPSTGAYDIGTWCWHHRQSAPCRVVDRQDMWGEDIYRVWLPAKDAVVRARSPELRTLESVELSADHVLHTAAAAKLLDALEDNLLLAPIQSSVVPLPHQLYALNRAISQHRIRYRSVAPAARTAVDGRRRRCGSRRTSRALASGGVRGLRIVRNSHRE